MKICINSHNVYYEYSMPGACANDDVHSYGLNGEYWFAMHKLKYSYIIRYNLDVTSAIYKYIDNRWEDRSS